MSTAYKIIGGLSALSIALAGLKLCGAINLSWWLVAAPAGVAAAYIALLAIVALAMGYLLDKIER